MKLSFEHLIAAPIGQVIDAHKKKDYYENKKKKKFGALSVEVLEWAEGGDGKLKNKAKVKEPSKLPSFIRKSDVDEYVEEAVLDPKAGTYTWKVTPSIMADKIFLSGKVEFHAAGDKTRVIYNTEFVAKIPLVGGKVEKYASGRIEEETQREADFLKEWLAG